MWDIIRELVADGVTVFLTTQYLEEADRLAHRIAVLDHGKVVAEGSPAELKRLVPGGRIRLAFADAGGPGSGGPRLRGRHHGMTRRLSLEIPSDGGVRSLRTVLERLDAHAIEVEGFAVETPDLDDVFLSLTHPRDEKVATR